MPVLHSTKIDLDETSSNDDLFGEANVAENPTESPSNSHNSIDTESEEKSEPNSNQQTNNPDHLLPSDLANLKLKPQCKTCQELISSEHINPKMGHLKHAHLAADSTKPKDLTKVILQHPQSRNQCL